MSACEALIKLLATVGASKKEGEIRMAHEITHFSLSSPPPFDVRAADVIRSLLDTMPPELQCGPSSMRMIA